MQIIQSVQKNAMIRDDRENLVMCSVARKFMIKVRKWKLFQKGKSTNETQDDWYRIRIIKELKD